MKLLSDDMFEGCLPAETSSFPSPVPTQIVSSDEYLPTPQTCRSKSEVQARLIEMSDRLAKRQGISRRRFFQTASGMAASFLAMNQVYGDICSPRARPRRRRPELANQLADAKSGQFIFDGHTHFLRDDTRLTWSFVKGRAGGRSNGGWNKELAGKEQDDRRPRNSTTTSKNSTWTATPR